MGWSERNDTGMNYKRQCLMGRSERNDTGWDELQEAVLDGTE